MLITKSGIKVIRYVHTERGLVDVDDLAPEARAQAATQIALTWMNALYRGKAVFEAEALSGAEATASSREGTLEAGACSLFAEGEPRPLRGGGAAGEPIRKEHLHDE